MKFQMGEFSEQDYNYAKSLGISADALNNQWQRFKDGFERIHLNRAATIGDGIVHLSTEESKSYIQIFEQEKSNYAIVKFVPSSGAASRMFLPFLEMIENPESENSKRLIHSLSSFSFYPDILEKAIEKGLDINELKEDPIALANFILNKEGLDYDNYPKGLISFARDNGKSKNAFELHLDEAKSISDGHIHFTVAEDYLDEIREKVNDNKAEYSIQDSSTHFISIYRNKAIRDESGQLLFRPSGHGALLKNLNELDADIVFIKNIDNIQQASKNKISIDVKKMLGGYLLAIKNQIDTFLFQLEEDENCDLEEISTWISDHLDPGFTKTQKEELIAFLHRPLRVAGMVLNEGKAGGGPFWVRNKKGIQLQIVENAQIDKSDPEQIEILASSTHFNPVDIVCALIDHRGHRFDLEDYVDKESGFLTKKVVNGVEAMTMERPGLWNASMANWLSIFIEIPLESFTPVKDVLDLLPSEKKQLIKS